MWQPKQADETNVAIKSSSRSQPDVSAVATFGFFEGKSRGHPTTYIQCFKSGSCHKLVSMGNCDREKYTPQEIIASLETRKRSLNKST